MRKGPSLEEHLRRIRPLGGKASMEARSAKERQEMGRKGGQAAAKARTRKQRRAIAQKAARARWLKAC